MSNGVHPTASAGRTTAPPPWPVPWNEPGPRYGFETHMLHLASWPQLAALPESDPPTVARICALLARRPTAGSLVPVLLDRPATQVYPLLDALHQAGHLLVSGEHPVQPESAQVVAATPASHSLLGQLWRRLGFLH